LNSALKQLSSAVTAEGVPPQLRQLVARGVENALVEA
jgi:hypothetical protein